MTNRDNYKRAFDKLIEMPQSISTDEILEKDRMSRQRGKAPFAAIAALVITLMGSGVAYATNVGGIQRTVQLWIEGDQTDAVIEFDGEGGYSMTYTDADGNEQEMGGGGVALEWNGERPLTEDELMEHFDMPDVIEDEDGRVIVYWRGTTTDITNRFEDSTCYVQLVDGDEVRYLVIQPNGGGGYGYTMRDDRYPTRWELALGL